MSAMGTTAENRNSAIRAILPDTGIPWDHRRDLPAEMARRLNAIVNVLYPATSQRNKIVAYVTARGEAQSTEIAAHVGLHVSSVGGHLRALTGQGRLRRVRYGRYALGPRELPGTPGLAAAGPPGDRA
jgi:DNA-binding CsgD family transcriptional regulator